MQLPDPSSSPEGHDRARRRSLFSRTAQETAVPTFADARAEALVSAYQQIVMERLEDGMRAIQQTANTLMHEIAGEVWRTAGGDKGEIQAKILESLSRDQAVRSLIAHSDERFQALTVRTARLEDTLNQLAEQARGARDALDRGAETLAGAAGSPAVREIAELRSQLEQVTRQIALAFETLAERDRAIVEIIQGRVREHGEIVAQETGRVAEAVQTYVEQGVSAMGHLAGRVETQVEAFAARDQDVTERLNAVVEEQMRRLGEQLQLLYDRMAVDTTSVTGSIANLVDRDEDRVRYLTEHLQLMHDRIGMEARDVVQAIEQLDARTQERLADAQADPGDALRAAEELNRTLEARVMGLARLVRSDSETLREELVRTTEATREELVRSAAAQDESVGRHLDESLGRVSEALTSATRWMVEELTRRTREESIRVIQGRLDEAVAAIGSMGEANAELIQGRLNDAVSALDTTREGMAEGLAETLDAHIVALAKMIRSDNRALAERIDVAADQDASKQALRAVKELQANLPAEVLDIVDRRVAQIAEQIHRDLQATTESVARVGDVLERKVDQVAVRMSERYDSDIQGVIERMGDAMHALASLGRQKPDRIDLE
jgi:hypothetical protein